MMSKSKTKKTIVGDIDADVLRFTAGEDTSLDELLVEADCIGTAAHVTALASAKLPTPILTTKERDGVIDELVGVMKRARDGKFKIGLKDQDVHLAVERALTSAVGDVGRKVHTGRSRNDQVAVDLRLHGKTLLLDTMDAAVVLAGVLVSFAKRHETLPMVGRTHMQPAMPSSVGLWASAHAESLLDDIVLLKGAYDITNVCPLGSAAGYGVPLELDRAAVARSLGFARPHANVLYASSARGKCEAGILAAMSQVMLTLSRLAEDLITYTMPEFGYFSLPPAHCTGSSIMPQKRNPDVLELIRARAPRVLACETAVVSIVQGLPSGYSRDLQETKEPFMTGTRITLACLQILAPLLRGLKPRKAALLAGFGPEVFATDKALDMVSEGVPFRTAYDRVKAGLGELQLLDSQELVNRRMRSGTARIGFDNLTGRMQDARRFARAERRRFHGAISRLLGKKYPELK